MQLRAVALAVASLAYIDGTGSASSPLLACHRPTQLKRMRFIDTPSAPLWQDGDTFLNNGADRLGLLAIGIFAAILARYILPHVLRSMRTL